MKTDPLERLHLLPLERLIGDLHKLVKARLWLQVVIGMFGGIIFGTLIGPTTGWVTPRVSQVISGWVALPGSLFLVLIQMIVVPLVFTSIIRGLAQSENMSQLKKLGFGAVTFFILATGLATLIGLGLGLVIKPGAYIDKAMIKATMQNAPEAIENVPSFPSLAEIPEKVTHVLPSNPLNAMARGEMLQVIVFAMIIGIALISIDTKKSMPLYDIAGAVQDVCMKVVSWAMFIAPLAVFGLVTKLTASVGLQVLKGIGVYVVTVLAGLLILFIIFGIIATLFSKVRFGEFFKHIRDVALLAFSTSSSAAVMPLSIQTAEERLHVTPSVARFLVPLGATMNMSGTALYQGVATVFLAQVFDVELSTGSLLLVVVMATAASIGSPAAPGAGMIILAMVLNSVGIPSSGIAIILGVDRLLDMSRTSVNVVSDLTACLVLDRMLGKSLSTASAGTAGTK
jgi:Na+/H+-dicarboxylate symporter